MRHLSLVDTNGFTAGITIFCKETLKAVAAVGMALPHDVALSSKLGVALKATEVLHVPVSSFSLCTFVCKNNLGLRDDSKTETETVLSLSTVVIMGTDVNILCL